ncbi:MAG: hypothetical protein CVV57_03675 [Tenericutes bacterium HGW-Tenericutes-2]|nr:MAG: hypothetical protein CVV57_03675 [Tenericutes bacterium HGW-Tenericutes-2]
MTIKKFMTFDLLVLTLLAVLVDVIGYFASLSDLVFLYVSLSIPVILIAYIRWGYKALVINLVIIILHLILYRGIQVLPMIVYLLSLGSISVSMIWFKLVKKNGIKDEVLLITLYFLTAYTTLFLLQAFAQYLEGGEIQWITLLIRHSVNIILGWVILVIASKQQDLMVDMHSYLLKQIEERKKEEKYDYGK